jgi:hypothetical protein
MVMRPIPKETRSRVGARSGTAANAGKGAINRAPTKAPYGRFCYTQRMPVRPEGMPKAAQEKPSDFDVQLENLTQQLEKSVGGGMDRADLVDIIARVFEHSITDGLVLSQRFRLTPDEIDNAVGRREFEGKHKQVAEKMLLLASQHQNEVIFRYGGTWQSNETKPYLKKVDALFAPLLASRELKLGPREKKQETGDKLAERFLSKVKRAYEHSYYTGPIWDLLKEVGVLRDGDNVPALAGSTITSEQLKDFWGESLGAMTFAELEKKLTKARYLLPDGVIQIEQKLAEKPLIENLKKLVGPDREVFLNTETGKYEIKEVEGKEKEVKEKTEEKKKEKPSYFESLERLKELLAGGANPKIILYSLTGLDTGSAWAWREELYNKKLISMDQFHDSINGLDSERAWKWRETFPWFGNVDGLDSPEAWADRSLMLKDGMFDGLAQSLIGLDSDKAWKLRDRLHKEGVNPNSLMKSLAGLDSKRAWDLREQLQNKASFDDIAFSLVGVDSPTARGWRNRLTVRTHLLSMTGLDSEQARAERRSFLGVVAPPINLLAKNLVGLDSEEDRLFRAELMSLIKNADRPAFAEGYLGVESEAGWAYREDLQKGDGSENIFAVVAMILKNQKARQEKSRPTEEKEKTEDEELDELEKRLAKGENANNIVELTAGMDSVRAWVLRDNCIILHGADRESYSKSLAFVNSENTWTGREVSIVLGVSNRARLASVTGLDDERAWKLRRDGQNNKNYVAVAESLMGLYSGSAINTRLELVNVAQKLEPQKRKELLNSLALSMSGFRDHPRHKSTDFQDYFLTRLRKEGVDEAILVRGKNEKPLAAYKRLLRESHEKHIGFENLEIGVLLDNLNLIHHPTLAGINHYLAYYSSEKEENKLSPKALKRLSQTIQDAPQAFLKTIAAKRDRNPEMLAQILFEKIYPDTVKAKKEVGLTTQIASFFGFKERPTLPDHESFLAPRGTDSLDGGGETINKDLRKVVEFRNEVPGLLVDSIYGGYNKESGMWQTAEFPLADTLGDPTRQTTGKIEGVKKLTLVRLPKPLSAKVVTERVKGVLPNGTEVPLEVRTDHLGMATVVNDKGADQILYSIEYDIAPTPMRDVSAKEYQNYLKRFETAHGKTLREQLPDLPEDVVSHIQTPEFRAFTPKEQVIEIERYVRAIGYYDTKNEETVPAKQGKTLGDKFFLAEMRAEELRSNGQPGLEGKRFAGVCADYAGITCALLRKAGFPSGVVGGLIIEGKQALMRDSHFTSYVVWPTQAQENQIVIVDGTPSSVQPEFAYAAGPTIEEREQTAHKEAEQAVNQAKTELKEISEVLKSKDAQAIKKLSNGKLERALNTILHHEVTDSHTDILKEMLNVYWYGGLKRMEGIQSDLELRKTMEAILDTRRLTRGKEMTTKKTEAGTELFEAMQDFIRKYKKSEGTGDSNQALDALEHIGDIAKASLQPTERQALDVIVTYLRAKKVG